MTDEDLTEAQPAPTPPRWRPIGAIDRRVLGVLAEKAKTTPDAYPMSLNAITTGCNQKNNRAPLMQLEADDVQESLDRLRELGAVGMIEGYGRVTKYRHYLYEWLGVEKIELSVMTELLLRGAQTEGELRGRAARMDPISDLSALRTMLTSLRGKGLVISLSPEGRGHVVSHALYSPKEMDHLKTQYSGANATGYQAEDSPGMAVAAPRSQPASASASPGTMPSAATATAPSPAGLDALRRELSELRSQLTQLRGVVEDLSTQQHRVDEQLRELRDALGG
jgi:uncharacterized protein